MENTLRELEFHRDMNALRIQAFERKAIKSDPLSSEFSECEAEIRRLREEQSRLALLITKKHAEEFRPLGEEG